MRIPNSWAILGPSHVEVGARPSRTRLIVSSLPVSSAEVMVELTYVSVLLVSDLILRSASARRVESVRSVSARRSWSSSSSPDVSSRKVEER